MDLCDVRCIEWCCQKITVYLNNFAEIKLYLLLSTVKQQFFTWDLISRIHEFLGPRENEYLVKIKFLYYLHI